VIVKKLSPISFGRFQNQTFELECGINLIEAPNEAGKSTLAAFLSGMLYGFFQRGSKRRIYTGAYERYLPWDNPGRYAGTMAVDCEGRSYLLERNFLRGADSVRLVDALTGEDLSDLMPYNAQLRIREPGAYFLGISQTAFEGTLYVPQQSAKAGAQLGAELADKMDEISRSGASGLSAEGALKWLDERSDEIGTPGRSASPLGALYKKKQSLIDEREDSRRKRDRAAEDAQKARALESEIEKLRGALSDAEAQKNRAQRHARWVRAEKAQQYQQKVDDLEKALRDRARYRHIDAEALGEAISACGMMEQSKRRSDTLLQEAKALDGQIDHALKMADSAAVGPESLSLSVEITRRAMRVTEREADLENRRRAQQEAQPASQMAGGQEPDRARRLMDRFEALPAGKPSPALFILGAALFALSAAGFVQPWFFGLLLPGAALVGLGAYRAFKRKSAAAEGRRILSELGVNAPEDLPALRQALDTFEHARREHDVAARMASEAENALKDAREALADLIAQTGFASAEAYHGAVALHKDALRECEALTDRREALTRRIEEECAEADRHAPAVRRAAESLGEDADADPGELRSRLAAHLREVSRYREDAKSLEGARQRLLDHLGADSYAALTQGAQPEAPPAHSLEAYDQQVRQLEKAIHEKKSEMDRHIANRDAIEDACRPPDEIERDILPVQEDIDALSQKLEAIKLAKERIADIANQMRKKLSPALGRSISAALASVTDGRYDKLLIDTDLTIRAQASGQTVSPDQLSGGTADAIYLALRLGLVDFLIPQQERMVILDDSFVQLDDDRAARMLGLIADSFKKSGQALLMTCTPRARHVLEARGIPHHTIAL
jgi:hypothetical protein